MDWLGLHDIHPEQWFTLSLKKWWLKMVYGSTTNRKVVVSLNLLVSWEVWNERNARVFRKNHVPPFVILSSIKKEVRLWVIAGAKKFERIMSGE
jgi:hypothetical protein